MKIKSFEIENFRSLKHLKIAEFDSTTIFYGLNNAGKSNILNALSLIFKKKPKLSVETQTLSDVENFYSGILPDFNNNYFNNTSDEIKFQVSLEVHSQELDIDDAIASLFPKAGNYIFIFTGTISKVEPVEFNNSESKIIQVSVGSKKIYEQGKNGFFYFPSSDRTRKNQSKLNDCFTRLVDVFNDCVYIIPSERDMLEANSSDGKSLAELQSAKEYLRAGDRKKALLILESLSTRPETDLNMSSLNSRSFKKFLYNLYLSPQKHHLFEAVDNTFSKEPFNFGNISFSKEKEMLEIMVKTGNFRLPIKYLGSGVMQSLFVITSIVCSKSRIICVEELEQNLSPKMQYQILKKIQQLITDNQLDQVILSSHSSVYSKPKLGLIYFLEKVNGATVINKKEAKELSSKLKEHLAETQFVFTEKDLKDMQEYLRKEHDFK